MVYVEGFVLPVPKKNVGKYKRMAQPMGKLMRKLGALEFRECKGVDLKGRKGMGLSFVKGAKAKKGETVFFSFIVYKSRAHSNAVWKRLMKHPSMDNMLKEMPFDTKRMMYGGFQSIVDE